MASLSAEFRSVLSLSGQSRRLPAGEAVEGLEKRVLARRLCDSDAVAGPRQGGGDVGRNAQMHEAGEGLGRARSLRQQDRESRAPPREMERHFDPASMQ